MGQRIYLNVLIYLEPGQAQLFRAYEDAALPRLARYGGRVECMFKPEAAGGDLALPDEVHLLSFDSEDGFERYRADPVVSELRHLREASVARAVFIRGHGL
ncbi:MAG: hypothetical protein R3286_13660 [Gammaproteobacteria bacterium]|nr:hypothetical protein [Gammaproteobacteria bacterium]